MTMQQLKNVTNFRDFKMNAAAKVLEFIMELLKNLFLCIITKTNPYIILSHYSFSCTHKVYFIIKNFNLYYAKITYLELELATLLFERLRLLFSESPRLTTPLPVMEKCRSR